MTLSAETRELYDFERAPLLIVISGPSGVGKDSVVEGLQDRDLPFHFVVTATTRPQRPDEVDGVDYVFVSMEAFAEMIENDQLIEYAIVYGDYKGIPKAQVQNALDSGKDVIMRLDVQGAATVRRLVPEAILVFITASSEEELVERLQQRKSDPPDQLKIRIATSRQEMRRVPEFDYVVVNEQGCLDEAVAQVEAIITAEHARTSPRRVSL